MFKDYRQKKLVLSSIAHVANKDTVIRSYGTGGCAITRGVINIFIQSQLGGAGWSHRNAFIDPFISGEYETTHYNVDLMAYAFYRSPLPSEIEVKGLDASLKYRGSWAMELSITAGRDKLTYVKKYDGLTFSYSLLDGVGLVGTDMSTDYSAIDNWQYNHHGMKISDAINKVQGMSKLLYSVLLGTIGWTSVLHGTNQGIVKGNYVTSFNKG